MSTTTAPTLARTLEAGWLLCPLGHEYTVEEAEMYGPCCPTPDPVEEAPECEHLSIDLAETGPVSYSGATEMYAVCEDCGWSELVGPGGGVL